MSLQKILKDSSGTPTGDYQLCAGGTLYADAPIGAISPYGGTTAPNGWFLCQGQAVSRTTYSELFAVIGTAFGTGDGSTTFNVPDLRGRTVVGYNSSETEFNALGKKGGEKTHTLTLAEMPKHVHDVAFNPNTGSIRGMQGWSDSTSYDATGTSVTNTSGGGQAHNILQPYNTVNYIIKAKMVAVPFDFVSHIEDVVYGSRVYFSDTIGSISGTNITTLKTITLPAGKIINGTMTTNLGATASSTVLLNLFARTTPPTTIDTSEVVVSTTNSPNYTQLTCPFCFTNTGSSDMTIRLGYYQGSATYSSSVRATYSIF